MLCICNGIQIPAGIFFQAIGKGIKSAIISLSRQIIFLIPAMVVLGYLFGIHGILFAGPFADGLAFVIASTLLIIEVKTLKKAEKIKREKPLLETPTPNVSTQKPIIITLSREYGSGGRYLGRLLANKLGINLYDKEFITKMAEETGLSEEYVENNEQKRDVLANLNNEYYYGLSNSDELFIKESEMIKDVASKESCVIVGRCADFILKDNNNVLKIFVYSDMQDKINRATKYYGMNEENAEKEINRIDKLRANHYKYYTGNTWKDFSNYDICINSDALGIEKSADFIANIIKEKINNK